MLNSQRLYVFLLLLTACHRPAISLADDVLAQQARSILSNRCFACHGPDEDERQGGLRLDDTAFIFLEADSGRSPIKPGDPGASELLRRILSEDEDERMPPAEFGKRLDLSEVETIRGWIEQGATLSGHWSFVALQRPPLPDWTTVRPLPEAWRHHPIDRFVARRQLENGLQPSPGATKAELLRRLSLDLIGLPPTLDEVERFELDQRPDSIEVQVDRLLASPAFGEHWARKWLDLARYADSAGYADDPPRTIWAYRDWVIHALNRNMSVKQFTIEQLGGDLLPHPSLDQLVATAFHRNTLTNNEGGTNDEEFRNVAVVDRVNTTMAVWMGITMACAQCHTHKYDPFTQHEYFQLFAIFNQSQDADRKDESPTVDLHTAEQVRRKSFWQLRQQQLEQWLSRITPPLKEGLRDWERNLSEPVWKPLEPISFYSTSKSDFNFEERTIRVLPTGNNIVTDTYTLRLQLEPGQPVSALGLRTLPREDLPGGGAGLAKGNFVVTGIVARLITDVSNRKRPTRFVRIVLPGKAKILSLAEVQVLSESRNVGLGATATQSTTAEGGEPSRAIDGETDGDFSRGSTTHTRPGNDPWWEVDLGGPYAVDSVVLWNRTDGNLQKRLDGALIQFLDPERKLLSETVLEQAPQRNQQVLFNQPQPIGFISAFADYAQQGFGAENVVSGDQASGWAVGGSLSQSHLLTLIPTEPLVLEQPAILEIDIEHNSSYRHHLLGSFRVESSTNPRTADWAMLSSDLLAMVRKPRSDRSDAEQAALEIFYGRYVAPINAAERNELRALEEQIANLKPDTSVPVMRQLEPHLLRETFVQLRGNYKSLGAKVGPGVPAVFHALTAEHSPTEGPDRLALAKWLVDRRNPLTARVWVNRLWESLFGQGIVRSSEEFGSQGDPPTHPQLLDWLACEFMDSDWDNKRMLKLIVMSNAYQQTSQVGKGAIEQDKDNVWLARGPRVRLSAEMVRDQALSVGGLLANTMHGPPVRPPQPNMGLKAAFGSDTDWKTSDGEDRYRRGTYTTWRRSNPYPSMATFDAPSREVCTLQRDSTNTPLQALVTLNDPGFVEAAQGLARRVVLYDKSLSTDSQRLQAAFKLCTARRASPPEMEALVDLLKMAKRHFAGDLVAAEQLATDPLGPLDSEATLVELAAWTSVCNVLLNLDEVLMKR